MPRPSMPNGSQSVRALRLLTIAALQGLEPLFYLGMLIVVGVCSGPQEAGHYAFLADFAAIFTLIAVFGFDLSGVRFVASALAAGDTQQAHAFSRFAQRVSVAVSVVAALIMAPSCLLLGGNGLAPLPLLLAAALIPLQALLLTQVGLLRGTGLIVAPRVLRAAPPAVTFGVAAAIGSAALPGNASATTLLAIHAAALAGALAVSSVLARRRLPGGAGPAAAPPRGQWLRASAGLVLVSGVMVVQTRLDSVMLTVFLGADETGVYATVVRIAAVLLLALTTANFLIAPRCAALHSVGDTDGLQRLVRRASRFSFCLAVPMAIALVFASRPLLAWLGDGYSAGRLPLLLMMFAYLFQTATGPVGIVATMTGNEMTLARTQGGAVAANVLLNLMVIPVWGLPGAALTTAAVTVIARAALVAAVRRRVGVSTLPITGLIDFPMRATPSKTTPRNQVAAGVNAPVALET